MEDTSQLVDSGIAAWMECVQWILSGIYFTAFRQWYFSLNGICCSEHYLEDTSQLVDSGIVAWMECVTLNIICYFTAGGQWYCSLNGVCCSEHYLEFTSQLVDSGIVAWMDCVTVKIIWKIIHSRWTMVLQLGWSVLQWTLAGRYFTAGGQMYCSLNGVCYSEHYLYFTSQLVDSVVATWMECVTVNIIWNLLHSKWTLTPSRSAKAIHSWCQYMRMCFTVGTNFYSEAVNIVSLT